MYSQIEIKKLYESNDIIKYNKILNCYSEIIEKIAIKKKKNPLFVELDKFYRLELPESIQNKGYITLDQLSKIMQYKLLRGPMRPSLQKMIDGNDPENVKLITKKGLTLLEEGLWLEGLKVLIDGLKGVGIATSSYIGALVRPDLCFIMSDEIISLFSYGKHSYTVPMYKKIQKELVNKVTILNSIDNNCNRQKNNDYIWTLVDIEKVFWTASN
jgi:hypothetical protein